MYKTHCQKWGLDLDLSFYVLNGNKKKPQNIRKVLKIFLPPYTSKQFFFFCSGILSRQCLFSIKKELNPDNTLQISYIDYYQVKRPNNAKYYSLYAWNKMVFKVFFWWDYFSYQHCKIHINTHKSNKCNNWLLQWHSFDSAKLSYIILFSW